MIVESGLPHHVCSNCNVENVFSVPFIHGLLKDGLHLRPAMCLHGTHSPALTCDAHFMRWVKSYCCIGGPILSHTLTLDGFPFSCVFVRTFVCAGMH